MIKPILIASGLFGLVASMDSENPPPFTPIETSGKLLWKAKIGMTTFRNNVVIQGDRLWIGSNGENFMDRGFIEPTSGVYGLNRKTGKKMEHFANEMFGDMDVAGLLAYKNRIYFGNDNEEFLCTDTKGRIIWRNPTSGDVEHEPTLIQTANGPTIVYAAESGEVKAVDPENGKVRWEYYTPDFTGWKPGQHRTIFKVKAWFSNTQSFFNKPLVTDLNLDGINDLVYRTYGGALIALDGNTGRKLWNIPYEDGMDMAIGILGNGKNKKIVGIRSFSDSNNVVHAECAFYNLNGRRVQSTPLADQTYGNGLNVLEIDAEHLMLNGLTSSYLVDIRGEINEFDRKASYSDTNWDSRFQSVTYTGQASGDGVTERYRNESNALFANRTIPLSNGKRGVVVLNQHDLANYEQAFIEILSIEDASIIARFSIPSGSEMPPVIRDFNSDGHLDILFGGYDGYLYCYQLPKL